MKRRQNLVVTIDGKPIVYGQDFKYIRQYLDDYCGPNCTFVKFELTKAKYPDDYWGSFFYDEPLHDSYDSVDRLEFKLYEIDFAAPTKEEKRDDDIEELLN